MKAATTISGHLKDLGRRDVQVVIDVAKWLESTTNDQRDINRRATSKRLGFRLVAANLLIKAFQGDVAACREVMDRTEGKVADIVLTGNLGEIIKALEAGRQRLIEAKTPQDVVVEGEVVTPPEDPQQQPISTESDTSK